MRVLQVANSLTARSLSKVVRRDLTQDINTEHHNKVHLYVDYSPLLSLVQIHIVYDSRSESPEHVGIPAGPVKVFSARQPLKETGYTSDESSQGTRNTRTRRQYKNKKEKIIWA